MVRIAPVRLSFNPKTLWFDAGKLDLKVGDDVVVLTGRGDEFGRVSQAPFDMEYEETKKLKSPLKPVLRIATEEDIAKDAELAELSKAALPIFRRMAEQSAPEMNPIAVEYLFGSDKAIFYFDSEERIDFRELVRKLASQFHVRIDMKQIGVRDGARMVGGLGHCGQELCCRRLGGQFNPVSIRMAKEQDLSLNPQKISGVCGRLMCCLRYEFDAYKDFHSRAPKKNAKIATPEGEGKVVDLDVPREVISIKVGDEKPVKVPLADMDLPEEGARPNSVGEDAWEKASTPQTYASIESGNLFTSQLSGDDKLAEPGSVRHVHGKDSASGSSKSRSRRRGSSRGSGGEGASAETAPTQRKQRRRRSTKVSSDGVSTVEENSKRASDSKAGESAKKPSSNRRRSRGKGQSKQASGKAQEQKSSNVKVGRNSSALRANRADNASSEGSGAASGAVRRRRRSHKTGQSGSEA